MRRSACVIAVLVAALASMASGAAAPAADLPSSPQAGATPAATLRPVGERCEPASWPFDPGDVHLTGAWAGDSGSIYYIRQVGSRVAWTGMSERWSEAQRLGREWSNVALGTLHDDLTVTLEWIDVPRGNSLGGGTLSLRVASDPGGSIQLEKTGETGGGFPDATLWPCAPATRVASLFSPAFEFRDETGVGLSLYQGHIAGVIVPGEPAGSGITVWLIEPGSGRSCTDWLIEGLEPGAAAFLDWLRSRTDLVLREDVQTTVDEHPAISVDVTAAEGAAACVDGAIRLWQTYGSDALMPVDGMTRVIVLEVGNATLAIEVWGIHQEEWLPLAQRVLDTIHFVE